MAPLRPISFRNRTKISKANLKFLLGSFKNTKKENIYIDIYIYIYILFFNTFDKLFCQIWPSSQNWVGNFTITPIIFGLSNSKKKNISYGNLLSALDPTSSSWLWKGIQKCKPFLISGACLRVSTSSHVLIWTTTWIPIIPSFRHSPKFPNNRNLPSLFVSDLILHRTTRWDMRIS
jgi:hypothetical protein